MIEESPPLLTLREAARLLEVDPRTLARWIRAGDVRAVRLASRWRIARAEVERILRAREEQS